MSRAIASRATTRRTWSSAFGREAIRDIENNFAALGSLIATAAELGRQDPRIFEDDRALAYLFRILQHSDTVLNVYVGLDDGSFRQARRIHDPKVPIHGAPPPEGAEFAYRLVEPALGLAGAGPLHLPRLQPEPPGRGGRGERLRSARPAVVRQGGRRRCHHDHGSRSLLGVRPGRHHRGGTVRGRQRADRRGCCGHHPGQLLRLSGAVTASARAASATSSTRTEWSSPRPMGRRSPAATTTRSTCITSARSSSGLVALAYGLRPRGDPAPVYAFSHDGRDYIAGLSDFDQSFGKRWQLFVVTPLEDFTRQFSQNNRRMLMLGLAATLVQLLIIYVLASLIASPLAEAGAQGRSGSTGWSSRGCRPWSRRCARSPCCRGRSRPWTSP